MFGFNVLLNVKSYGHFVKTSVGPLLSKSQLILKTVLQSDKVSVAMDKKLISDINHVSVASYLFYYSDVELIPKPRQYLNPDHLVSLSVLQYLLNLVVRCNSPIMTLLFLFSLRSQL